jgi:alanine racemase
MDQFVLDVGSDSVKVGDEVVIFGDAKKGEPTAEELAEAAGTINYEIVTRIGGRAKRVFR